MQRSSVKGGRRSSPVTEHDRKERLREVEGHRAVHGYRRLESLGGKCGVESWLLRQMEKDTRNLVDETVTFPARRRPAAAAGPPAGAWRAVVPP